MYKKIIDCKNIADNIIIKENKNKTDKLYLFFQSGMIDSGSESYIKQIKKIMNEHNIKNIKVDLDEFNFPLDKIREVDSKGYPIMFMKPMSDWILNNLDFDYNLDSKNDMDGIKKENHLYECRMPNTAQAILEILNSQQVQDYIKEKGGIEGMTIVLLNRSDTIGRPLLRFLSMYNCNLIVCNSYTQNLRFFTQQADILITAIGKPKKIDHTYICDGCIVIDAGINVDENNKLCGDVDLDDVMESVGLITPVPNGVGVVTSKILEKRILEYDKK